ncbi:UvrB/UvrC protein, partial [mine drainage metagenome]
MLCQECHSRPATVHLTKVIGDEVEQLHLCAECAREKGELQIFTDPAALMQNLLANFVGFQPVEVQEVPACPTCGFGFGEFRATGRLGCPSCYAHFEAQLKPILRRLHGTTDHRGKLPARRGDQYRRGRQMAEIKERLTRAVAH